MAFFSKFVVLLMLSFPKEELQIYATSTTSFPRHPSRSIAVQTMALFTPASSSQNKPQSRIRECKQKHTYIPFTRSPFYYGMGSKESGPIQRFGNTVAHFVTLHIEFSSTNTVIMPAKQEFFNLIDV